MGKIDDIFGSMAFFLPEHAEALAQHAYEKTLVTQPILEDDELAEMNLTLYDSVRHDFAVSVSWFKPIKGHLGRIERAWGWVQRIDASRRQIKLVNDDDFWWIDVARIVKVEKT